MKIKDKIKVILDRPENQCHPVGHCFGIVTAITCDESFVRIEIIKQTVPEIPDIYIMFDQLIIPMNDIWNDGKEIFVEQLLGKSPSYPRELDT